MEDLKKALYEFCSNQQQMRLSKIKERIAGLEESLNSETKSSAGDKHETGRAMIQLEREKLGVQLAEAEKTTQLLNTVSIEGTLSKVHLGSLVHTSLASYFIAISSGEYVNKGQSIFCISPMTPIGKLLMGKGQGDMISFNNQKSTIKEIL